MIQIDVRKQTLLLKNGRHELLAEYPISTAKNGSGEKQGSEKTPRGAHVIAEKIGENMPIFTVFRARVPTDEIYSAELEKQCPDRDWILSRILWLNGSQTSLDRYIYIHGTHDEKNIGVPHSHGCIRMRNQDVIDLFERVEVGQNVLIKE